MFDRFKMGGLDIRATSAPLVIAEISCNHNGSLDKALQLIDAAAQSGAHAVKFQTYTAQTMTIRCNRPDFYISGGLWDGYELYDLYDQAHTPWDWHPALFAKAKECGLLAFSTPFDESAVDFLEQFDPPAYKVASFEANDHRLIRKVVATGKPLIISTGLLLPDEIVEVVDLVRREGGRTLVLMHCISAYPAPVESSNVRTIADMAERFNVPVGLSDHTLGSAAVLGAVAMGASLIEKHFILSRNESGLDAAFSMQPEELAAMCTAIREVHAAIGGICYGPAGAGRESLNFRRSLYVVEDVKEGASLSEHNVRIIRPGHGLSPKYYDNVICRRAARDIERGTPLSWDLIA